MSFLRRLFNMDPSSADTVVQDDAVLSERPSSAEAIIAALRSRSAQEALCWIVCYEQRPLQGAPPDNDQPHLMIFSSESLAAGFIAGRRRFFMPEPLSVVAVDVASTLKRLVVTPADDARYAPPPYGLLLNFTYPTGATDRTLAPQRAANADPDQLASELGL